MRSVKAVPAVLAFLLAACGGDPTPATRDLRVSVVDESGAPVSGEGIILWWAEDPEAEWGHPAGRFEGGETVLEGLPRKDIVLAALPDGFVVPSVGWPRTPVPATADHIRLVLDVGAERRLRVLGWPEGRTGSLYLAATEDLEPSEHAVGDQGLVDVTGLRAGVSYNVYVRDWDTGRCALLRGLPGAGPWPEIEVGAGETVTGRIHRPEGADQPNVALLVDKAVMIGGTVEEDGTFRIVAVPPGTYTAVAYTMIGERYLATTAEVAAGGEVTLDLRRAAK